METQYIEARLIIPWGSDGTADEAATMVAHIEGRAVTDDLARATSELVPYGWIVGFEVHDGAPPR